MNWRRPTGRSPLRRSSGRGRASPSSIAPIGWSAPTALIPAGSAPGTRRPTCRSNAPRWKPWRAPRAKHGATARPLRNGSKAPMARLRWAAAAERAGRGEDYLVWRLRGLAEEDFAADLARSVASSLGRMLSRSGVESALVGPDGRSARPARLRAPRGGRSRGDACRAGFRRAAPLRRARAHLLRARRAPGHAADADPRAAGRDGRRRAHPSGRGAIADAAGRRAVSVWAAKQAAGSAATPQLEALLGALPLGPGDDRPRRALPVRQRRVPPRRRRSKATHCRRIPSDLVVREDKAAMADAVRRFGKGPAAATTWRCGCATSPKNRSAWASPACAGWARRRCC